MSQTDNFQETMLLKDNQMVFLKRKLDSDIGYNYWKKYVASAFWAQISTPINLVITFLTAITTAQAQTQELIPQNLFSQLTIVSLIITTLNTFFRPHTQYSTNTEYLGKWNDIGVHFEKEYTEKVNTHLFTKEGLAAVDAKIVKYKEIQEEVTNLRKAEGTNTINFVTDLVFLIAYNTCIRNHKKWLDLDKQIMIQTKNKFNLQKQKDDEEELKNMERESNLRIKRLELEKSEQAAIRRIEEMWKERDVSEMKVVNREECKQEKEEHNSTIQIHVESQE